MVKFEYNSEEKTIKVIFTGRLDYLATGEFSEIIQSEPIMKNRNPEDSIIFDIGGATISPPLLSGFVQSTQNKPGRAGFRLPIVSHL